ncbi:hypothetical protein E2C01_080815 [Portunus trituberculatus]|uniref:Uncharacterized protein n=1 Tax=Portunus trituberculatus TaxID=210409 RepID=A0A5B7IUD5_PORTR|nr:hypothetical protein [Portunus trituberculatus]
MCPSIEVVNGLTIQTRVAYYWHNGTQVTGFTERTGKGSLAVAFRPLTCCWSSHPTHSTTAPQHHTLTQPPSLPCPACFSLPSLDLYLLKVLLSFKTVLLG